MSKKGLAETYQKLTDVEHVLHRPDTYIGDMTLKTGPMWILDMESWPLVEPPKPMVSVEKPKEGVTEEVFEEEEQQPEEMDEKEEKEEFVPPTPKTPATPSTDKSVDPSSAFEDSEQKQPEVKEIKRYARIIEKEIDYVPGFLKIVDEVLVNAFDHRQRCKSCNKIKVFISDDGWISCWNNGSAIPVQKHPEHKVYIPEMIFGQLRSGTTYDDSEKRTTGGRNGFGAKLANIFSVEFQVETNDAKQGLLYKQTWSNNMKVQPPVITPSLSKDEYTKISFLPDFKRFKMKGINQDLKALLYRRVFDGAAVSSGTVSLNKNRIQLGSKNFLEYCNMYVLPSDPQERYYEKLSDRWQIAVSVLPDADGFGQISFVNGISTTEGGKHVDCILDQIVSVVVAHVQTKAKTIKIKNAMVKDRLFLFVNSLIENPAFTNQSKTYLTTNKSEFGSSPVLSKKFMKKLLNAKSGLVESILEAAKLQDGALLKKSDGKKVSKIDVDKLEDALMAGTSESEKCTLYLTEGDSAKTLIMSGFAIIGKKYNGVFPLRGKIVNVRDANVAAIQKNKEFANIKKILGLKNGEVYEDTKKLRYSKVVMATDQDTDGYHIKGLGANLFDSFWPMLLKIPGFFSFFRTPVVKAFKKGQPSEWFYSEPDFEAWKLKTGGGEGYTPKFYKGLGTSTNIEAKEYFSDLKKHQIDFQWDEKTDSKMLDMAFNKKLADKRKKWIAEQRLLNQGVLHADLKTMSYGDFVNKELILFAIAANERAIPSLVDGLKTVQRKVMFGVFKRNLTKEIKVTSLTGYVTEHGAYHHGDSSLNGTIIGMAQNYVGSNNINLLVPSGQFGTRLLNGKDSASPRYINTYMAPIARALFVVEDDLILKHLEDDHKIIEPNYYLPVVPLILINGCSGIGHGWSTDVPCFNPKDVIANIRSLLKKEEMKLMVPFIRGFKGTIQPDKAGFVANGIIKPTSDKTLQIDEITCSRSITAYKEFLSGLVKAGSIDDFVDESVEGEVKFILHLNAKQMDSAKKMGYLKRFKLQQSIPTTNMVLFNTDQQLKKYANVEQIMKEFFTFRLPLFEKRRLKILEKKKHELMILSNKARFILMVVSEELMIRGIPEKQTLLKLKELKFDLIQEVKKNREEEDVSQRDLLKQLPDKKEQKEIKEEKEDLKAGYAYLLNLKIARLTKEQVEKLKQEHSLKEKEVQQLENTTSSDLWLSDLENLEKQLEKDEKHLLDQNRESKEFTEKHRKGKGASESSTKPRKRKERDVSKTPSRSKKPLKKKLKVSK